MKILLVHNVYGFPYGLTSGEESLVNNAQRLLEEKGHQVVPFFRSSKEINEMMFGKSRAFFSGVYSWSSRKAILEILKLHRPDVAFVHNVFPFISPSVLVECRRAGVPVVMSVNNYRLICPNGLFLTKEQICEKCAGGREYWCVLRNCEQDILKSVGYALRNTVARWLRLFIDNVTIYVVFTEFQRQKLIANGFPSERIFVIPNMVNYKDKDIENLTSEGRYVGHVGRISPEKGILVLVEAARRCPEMPFKTTGSVARMPYVVQEAPNNFEFAGFIDNSELEAFYARSRFIVIPTLCYEGFPTVCAEAMMSGKAVIVSHIGGMAEIVEDGVTGLLFEPGNANDLTEKIRYLWERIDLCRKMGQAGREKALREYSQEKYYERLMAVYEKAISLGPAGPNS